MFQIIANVLFALECTLLMASPVVIFKSKLEEKFFCVIWVLLYVSQLFMYQIGADVSPWAYVTDSLQSIRYFGLTLSAISSGVIVVYVLIDCIHDFRNLTNRSIIAFILVLIPSVYGLLLSRSIQSGIDSVIKLMFPFLILLFLNRNKIKEETSTLNSTIFVINIIVILQIIICKMTTGSFSAYTYYYELEEEFLGFFSHPHLLAGLLSLLCIWNIWSIQHKWKSKANAVLFLTGITLIVLLGTRTYLVSLGAALFVYAIVHLFHKIKLIKFRILCVISLICFVLVAVIIYVAIGPERITDDVSSGRFERWAADLSYAINNYSPLEIMFGRGVDASYDINLTLFNRSINSLNLVIDLFIDYGAIGMTMILAAYVLLFREAFLEGATPIQCALAVSFVVTSLINSVVSYSVIMSMLVVIQFVAAHWKKGSNEDSCLESPTVS